MKVSTIKNIFGATLISAGAVCMYPPTTKKDVTCKGDIFVSASSSVRPDSSEKIVIIDNFDTDYVKLDYDMKSDIPHGFVVNKFISKSLPDAKIKRINLPLDEKYTTTFNHNDSPLKTIITDLRHGHKISAINISVGASVSYDELSKQTNIEITPENIKERKDTLKSYLRAHSEKGLKGEIDSIHIKPIMDFINDLDTISSKGVKIYVAAGNSKNDALNMASLIDDAIVVGALGIDGKKAGYSADNSLVNRWECGSYFINKTKDGYNFTGGDGADVKYEETTGLFKARKIFPILVGTSYAAPRALINDLQEKE